MNPTLVGASAGALLFAFLLWQALVRKVAWFPGDEIFVRRFNSEGFRIRVVALLVTLAGFIRVIVAELTR